MFSTRRPPHSGQKHFNPVIGSTSSGSQQLFVQYLELRFELLKLPMDFGGLFFLKDFYDYTLGKFNLLSSYFCYLFELALN